MKPEIVPDYADIMTIEDFEESCKTSLFVNSDGSGYYAEKFRNNMIMYRNFPAIPFNFKKGNIDREFTHVAWFNK